MTGKVKLVSAGGGSVSLATPSTGSNRTVTLPDADLTIPATNSSGTLTTQGDTLYRDGSGIQRLAKGTASQVLTMNSGATAPEWAAAAAGGKVLQIVQTVKKDTFSTAQANTGTNNTDLSYMVDVTGLSVTITPTNSSSKILISWHISYCSARYTAGIIRRKVGSATAAILTGANATTVSNRPGVAFSIGGNQDMDDNDLTKLNAAGSYLDAHGQTDTLIYNIAVGGTNTGDPELTINRNDYTDEDNAYNNISTSAITVVEFSS
jgi:hypothetical protein